MTREPNNEASEKLARLNKHWFICVENTAATSPIDIDEFCELMDDVCKRYNMRWCQAFWKEELMDRIKR